MVNFFKTVFRNVTRKPATRRYPFVRRAAIAGSRGMLVNDVKSCIFCSLCAKRCPSNALAVSKTPKTWTLDPYRCIVCGYCVEVCPKKCLSMQAEHGKFNA